jgi:IclR family pca regulon transcriptional regulator
VRQRTYSLVDEEAERGFRSLAVPVRRLHGGIACALHIGVRIERVDISRMLDEFLPLLNAAAAEAETMLL